MFGTATVSRLSELCLALRVTHTVPAMPPKNKGKSMKSAKTRTPTLIDGLTQEELSKEQLEEHIVHLREELDREREERNYFQVERDRMHSFREITERQLEEAKAELKNLAKEVEAEEGHHQVEVKVYKQKMKHLLCEHQNMILELKADRLASVEVMQKEQEQLETKFHKQINAILAEKEKLKTEDLVKEIEQKHDEELTRTRKSWEKQLADVKAKYEKKMELLPQELDNMSKYQISESENHWNSHVVALTDDHNKALSEMNALVNQMQHDVDVNCSLQAQITDMKLKQKEKEKDLVSVLLDNKHLNELLLDMGEEIAVNARKMKNYSKNLQEAIEKAKNKELSDLKTDYDTLERLFSELQLEREELYKSFSERIQKVQHKGDVKNELLERKVKALTDSLEEMQTQLSSVLSASNMDQTALDEITDKIEKKIDTCNDSIKNLKNKKAQIAKAHKELLLDYESKQRALGIPVEETCAEPIENILTPPKKKGKGKGKSGKGKKGAAQPMSEEEAKEQLEILTQLRKELDKERDERNYAQLERDRITAFWEITERQLAEMKDELKNLDKEAEEDEGSHKSEIKTYMQKLKYLRYEYHRTVSDLNAKGLVYAEVLGKEQEQLEGELHKEFSSILVDMQELDTENLVKELEEKHDEEMIKTRNIWEKQLADIEAKYDLKMELLPKALDNMSRNILREREDHWNSHIVALIKDHNKALSETNALVNHMQHDVDVNCSLETQITEMKLKQKEKEKDLVPILLDNKRLTDFLLDVEEEITENEKRMKSYAKGLHEAIEKAKNKELNDLKTDYDTLERLFSELQREREELYKSFSERIQKVQHKGDVKNELLERKVKALTDSLEEMQTQLSSVLSASNMDQTALDEITDKIEKKIDTWNDSIKNLKNKKAQIAKARKELLLDYESKQRALGIPVEDFCKISL